MAAGVGENVCTSTPAGTRLITVAWSPATVRTRSANTVVDATTWSDAVPLGAGWVGPDPAEQAHRPIAATKRRVDRARVTAVIVRLSIYSCQLRGACEPAEGGEISWRWTSAGSR